MRTSFQFASVCAIGLLAVACDDPNRGPPTRYWYFDAVVDFTAEGQRLKAETTVQCMTPGGLTPGHRPLHPTPSHSIVTKRLPSGAGIVFSFGKACYGPPKYVSNSIWSVDWLDDVTAPTVIEKYFSLSAIGPGKPIEAIHSFDVSDGYGYGEVPRPYSDPTIEVPWLKSQKFENRNKRKVVWRGFLAFYAPKELWDRHATLVEKLEGRRGVVHLNASEIPDDVRKLVDYKTVHSRPIWPPASDKSTAPHQNSPRTRTVLQAADGTYRFSFKPDWPCGKVVFTPFPHPLHRNKPDQIFVDGLLIVDAARGPSFDLTPYFYDTRTQMLFHISSHRF